MTQRTLVLLGNLPEVAELSPLVQELGWTLETASSLNELRDLSSGGKPAAILFDAKALNLCWKDALGSVRDIDPNALLILCHRFSDVLNWPYLADNGAFHALAVPFDPVEVRRSLAFVWAARLHRAVIPMRKAEQSATAEECDGSPRHGSCVA